MTSRNLKDFKAVERLLHDGVSLFQGQRAISLIRQFQDFLAQVAVSGPALERTISTGVPTGQSLAQCNRVNGIL